MAHDALRFIDALGLTEIDVLGFSIGGFVAQELALIRPQLVRRLVLAGTGPQGGRDARLDRRRLSARTARRPRRRGPPVSVLRAERDQHAKGREFVERIYTRDEDRDADATLTPATRSWTQSAPGASPTRPGSTGSPASPSRCSSPTVTTTS